MSDWCGNLREALIYGAGSVFCVLLAGLSSHGTALLLACAAVDYGLAAVCLVEFVRRETVS